MNKIFKRKHLILGIVFLLFLLMFLFALFCSFNTSSSEFFTRYISRIYISFFSFVTSLIPISITEIFTVFIFIFCVGLLIKGIFCFIYKNVKEGLYKISLIITIIFGCISSYYFACGPAYNRDTLPVTLYEEKVEKSEYLPIISYYLDDFNACCDKLNFKENGQLISPYSLEKINEIIIREYQKIDDDYFHPFTPRSKPMASSALYLSFGIAGVSFSSLGEANINALNVTSDIPFSIAHEIAHIKGVMREKDANLLASYILLNSDDYFLRYSGYMRTFFNLLDIVNFLDKPNDIKQMIYSKMDGMIFLNNNYNYNYLTDSNILRIIADFFNDLYLKIFSGDGLGAYDDNMDEEDSGQKDDDGNIIYNPIYSVTQKMMFYKYYSENDLL